MTATLNLLKLSNEEKIHRISGLIGQTPLYEIKNVVQKPGIRIFAKLEWHQIGGSVKARPAFNIIKNALRKGLFSAGQHLLDATSGNTGIAYAAIGAALGIPVTLCLPENASQERKMLLKALGANIIFTSKFDGTDGAQLEAKALFKEQPERFFYADQYANDCNWRAHFETTAPEIWHQTNGKITHFVAGLGTTGTFTGTGRKLRCFNNNINLIALQPDNPMHSLEGWKHLETAISPKIYDNTLADGVLEVETLEAFDMIRQVAQKEGLLLSPSSAANLLGAIKVANEIDQGVIVTTFADSADKYSDLLNNIFGNN